MLIICPARLARVLTAWCWHPESTASSASDSEASEGSGAATHLQRNLPTPGVPGEGLGPKALRLLLEGLELDNIDALEPCRLALQVGATASSLASSRAPQPPCQYLDS